jgi:elongation factor Ts
VSQISAAAVKELRDRTDMPMMKCKAALEKAGGDVDKAMQLLREEGGKFLAGDKGARETAEGRIAAYADLTQKVAALVELRCETPSVVKNDYFVALGNDIARQVAEKSPKDVDELLKQPLFNDPARTVQDRIADVVGRIRENMRVSRFLRVAGLAGTYVHHDGTSGALVEVKGERADPELLKDIAAHIVALKPAYISKDDIPADVLKREQELARKQAEEQAAGKPANVLEKIAEGKFRTWMAEPGNVLLEQPMANVGKYPKKTVGEVLKAAKLEVVSFVRYKVGEK